MATPSEAELGLSVEKLTELSHLSNLLHLFLHRNKNQHRHSIWFRHFGTFRQNLSIFLRDCKALNTIPTSHAARAKKKKKSDPLLISRLRARLDHWRDFLVPKWHHAFSQVIADQRFSVLGLFLLGLLAEVCQVVGITAELEEMGNEEVRRVIEAFGREEEEEKERHASNVIGKEDDSGMREDAGELIRRENEMELVHEADALPSLTKAADGAVTSRKRPLEAASDEKRKKKKKRKKAGGDAIDDIFG